MNLTKKDTKKLYNLKDEVVFCKKCTVSNQRPRITFNDDGVCSACQFSEEKKKFDWDLREKELKDLCDRFRKNDGSYDVIVPVSGGKDGSFVAHNLKYKYGMNPLTVTWAPNVYTDVGRKNLESLIDSGLCNILGKPNGMTNRILCKLALIHLGDPFQPFIYGQTNFPLKMAILHDIPLIMYGENGEVEYGGDMKNAFKPTRDVEDHNFHYFSNFPPEIWNEYGIDKNDLKPYMSPPIELVKEKKIEVHFMGYYKYWDPQENFYYCVENTGFVPNPERNCATYSKYASLDDKIDGFHYLLGYIKFGIGRATSDSAHEIRDGKITREEGIALVKKYDGEFPSKYFKEFLAYVDLSESQFNEIVDTWRSEHIWQQKNGLWSLKKAIYDDTSTNI